MNIIYFHKIKASYEIQGWKLCLGGQSWHLHTFKPPIFHSYISPISLSLPYTFFSPKWAISTLKILSFITLYFIINIKKQEQEQWLFHLLLILMVVLKRNIGGLPIKRYIYWLSHLSFFSLYIYELWPLFYMHSLPCYITWWCDICHTLYINL